MEDGRGKMEDVFVKKIGIENSKSEILAVKYYFYRKSIS